MMQLAHHPTVRQFHEPEAAGGPPARLQTPKLIDQAIKIGIVSAKAPGDPFIGRNNEINAN